MSDDSSSNSRQKARPKGPPKKFGLFEFIVGGLFCVGFPGFMTAVAPVSWIDLQRVDQRVDAKTRTCVFFAIPYYTQKLTDVRDVSTTFRQGALRHKRAGDRKEGREESGGHVVLHGPKTGPQNEVENEISVSVSPASYKQVEAQVKEFLADPQKQTLTLFTVANWKFGVIFAIPVCLLTVLFVVGWTIWLGQAFLSPIRWALKTNTDETEIEQSS